LFSAACASWPRQPRFSILKKRCCYQPRKQAVHWLKVSPQRTSGISVLNFQESL